MNARVNVQKWGWGKKLYRFYHMNVNMTSNNNQIFYDAVVVVVA